MKTKKINWNVLVIAVFALASLMLFPVRSWAQMIHAEIIAVDPAKQMITVNEVSESGAVTKENIKLKLDETTTFSGVKSAQELKVGDKIQVRVEKQGLPEGAAKAASVSAEKKEANAAKDLEATNQNKGASNETAAANSRSQGSEVTGQPAGAGAGSLKQGGSEQQPNAGSAETKNPS